MPLALIWISSLMIDLGAQSSFVTHSYIKSMVPKTKQTNASEAQRYKLIEFGITPTIKKRSLVKTIVDRLHF